MPPMNGMMWRRVQTTGPTSTGVRPASSASSRRIASTGVSPGSIPPPGVAQNVPCGNWKRTSRIRSSGSSTMARAAGRIRSSAIGSRQGYEGSSRAGAPVRESPRQRERQLKEGMMRGFIAALFLGVMVFLAVGCGGKSNDTAGTTTVVVTETTAATTSTEADTTATTDMDTTATDTTTTDTTSTDTTSTDTTATDTTTTAAGLTVGCQKVANLSVQFGKALSAAGASGGTDLEKTAKAYEAFAQQVPSEIRDAFETLAKAYAQYAVAIKGIDFKAGQVPDAATIAKLTKAAQALNGQDLTKANADISVWVTKN